MKQYYQIGATAPIKTKVLGQFDYRALAQKAMHDSSVKSPYAVFWSDLNANETNFYPYQTLEEASSQYEAITKNLHDPKWNRPSGKPVVYATLLDRKNPLDGSNEDLKPDTDESRYIRDEGYWVAENDIETIKTETKTIEHTTMTPGKKAAVGIGLGVGIIALIANAKGH